MKNKKIFKNFSTILLITLLLLITNSGKVNAALQANKNTQYTKTDRAEGWMQTFRQMEKAGEAMGLSETLDIDLSSSNRSNNIDVHMMKTTEYGAIAILSASGYGNPSNEQAITSTTGNATGVMLNTANWEWTAGGKKDIIFSGVNPKYFDTYSGEEYSVRVGDALGNATTDNPGCAGWHSASKPNPWSFGPTPYVARGQGNIFSFATQYNGVSNYYISCARGVAICGKEL